MEALIKLNQVAEAILGFESGLCSFCVGRSRMVKNVLEEAVRRTCLRLNETKEEAREKELTLRSYHPAGCRLE